MKSIKSRNYLYFLLAFVLTISIMLLKKSNILVTLSEKITPRSLLEERKKKYVCDKAGSRLTDKYRTDFKENSHKKKSLSKAQKSLVDFIRDQTYSNLKPYIKHCGIFIFFLVLDIILIFLWISYCSCCCCSCCLFNRAKPNKFCSCLFFFISAICSLIAFIISIIILGVLKSFFSRINGLGCSTYYFLDHVQSGLAPSYINHQGEWEGLNGLIKKIENTQLEADIIKKDSNNLNSEIESLNSIYEGQEEKCKVHYIALKNNAKTINDLIGNSFDALNDGSAINDLKDANKTVGDAEDNAGDTIYDVLHDHLNNYLKRIFKLIFTLTLIFSLLSFLILISYIFFNNCIFRIIYIVIWNILMLLILFSILAGVVFGIIGYVFSDGVQVAYYILSSENLNGVDPIVFKSKNSQVSNLIDTCSNGNGNFTNVLEGGEELNQNLKKWKENQESYENAKNSINCENTTKTNELKRYYDQLLNTINKSLVLTYNITNVSCSFAKNDKNILLNEIDTGGNKSIGLCACSFLVGIFLGISVLAGIILVHKYQLTSNKAVNKDLNNVNFNESKEDIKK